MKSILTKKVLFLALVAVTVFATGCIKEDLDECYKLTLKVVNHKGDDITALSVVSEAKLFIYDNNSKLLDTRDLNDAFIRGKETIELNYPESSKLHLIAWGNLKGHQDVNEATKAEDFAALDRLADKTLESAFSDHTQRERARDVLHVLAILDRRAHV